MSSHPPIPEADPLVDLLDIEIDWFYFTKEKLSPEAVRVGLLDHGLFGEKVPPCFVSDGLAAVAMEVMADLHDETDEQKLRKSIDNAGHDYVRYEALRDINIPGTWGYLTRSAMQCRLLPFPSIGRRLPNTATSPPQR